MYFIVFLCFVSFSLLGFLPNYLLPDYEEVVNRPPTPPPPYSALHMGPSSVASSPVASEQQEGLCPTIQDTPVPAVSDSLCCRSSTEEPQPTTLDFLPKPNNKPTQAPQDSGMIVLSGGLNDEGLTSQDKISRDDSCKDPLLKDLSDSCAEDKDRLPNGRRRRFTGDSGIEVCVCSTRGSNGCSGAGGTGQDGKELRELESLLGCDGDEEEEQDREEVGDFCDSCINQASFSAEEEQVLGGLERQLARRPSGPPQPAQQIGSHSPNPPVCLLLHTINEQEGPHNSISTEPQGWTSAHLQHRRLRALETRRGRHAVILKHVFYINHASIFTNVCDLDKTAAGAGEWLRSKGLEGRASQCWTVCSGLYSESTRSWTACDSTFSPSDVLLIQ